MVCACAEFGGVAADCAGCCDDKAPAFAFLDVARGRWPKQVDPRCPHATSVNASNFEFILKII
jgi:hypothetical protein